MIIELDLKDGGSSLLQSSRDGTLCSWPTVNERWPKCRALQVIYANLSHFLFKNGSWTSFFLDYINYNDFETTKIKKKYFILRYEVQFIIASLKKPWPVFLTTDNIQKCTKYNKDSFCFTIFKCTVFVRSESSQ